MGIEDERSSPDKGPRQEPRVKRPSRIGELPVYYEVNGERRVVEVRAVGIKDRDRRLHRGLEIKLS